MRTEFRSIEAAPEGVTPVYVESVDVPDPPISTTACRSLDVNPLPAMDSRIVMLDGQRRTLSGLTADEREALTSSSNLPHESVEWIARVLPLQQALVVPFNPVMVSVEPCNMACVPTGTATQAKGATYYQSKYSSKDRCASLVARACHTRCCSFACQQPHIRDGIRAADGIRCAAH